MNHINLTHSKLKNKKTAVIFAALLIPSVLLLGCGASGFTATTVSIDKDGKVVSTIIEDFGESNYDLNELNDMAAAEVSAYNSEFISEKVFLDSSVKDEETGAVKMVISFNSTSDYSHFNQVSLFYGTVQEALDKGYKVSEDLIDHDGNVLGGDGINSNLDRHIVITTDKTNMIAPYNISYMSKGTQLKGKKEAILTDVSSDTVQLLLSK